MYFNNDDIKANVLSVSAGPVTEELSSLMRCVWGPVVGFDYEIRVLHLERPKNVYKLGFSLIGTTLVEAPGSVAIGDDNASIASSNVYPADAKEHQTKPATHFVESVEDDCLFNTLLPRDSLKPGDQLLQANGQRLWGVSYKRVLQCLRNLPSHIELVIARNIISSNAFMTPERNHFFVDMNDDPMHVNSSEVGSILDETAPKLNLGSLPPVGRTAEWVRSTNNLSSPDAFNEPLSHIPIDQYGTMRSSISNFDAMSSISSVQSMSNCQLPNSVMNLEELTFTTQPTWFEIPLVIQLQKDSSGFGFSLTEYESLPISDFDDSFASVGQRAALRLKRTSSTMNSPQRAWRSQTVSPKRPPLKESYFNPDAQLDLHRRSDHALAAKRSNSLPKHYRKRQQQSILLSNLYIEYLTPFSASYCELMEVKPPYAK
ncbi:hypothetical protein Ciccas_001431 [Cichlidogyrus casuarinus]|uniref:PDZ domain-containing protein n=1 Tax=Cichlidogyrus casuarinus TaxID=1844966 RepID=A0ABD2QK46_9PLAT